MALFRVDFSGRGELADRQQKLAQMLSRLQKISEGTTFDQPIAADVLSFREKIIANLRHLNPRQSIMWQSSSPTR